MPELTQYLRFLARVSPENTVRKVRTQITHHADPSLAQAEPAAWGEFVSAEGGLLLRWPVVGTYLCTFIPERPREPDLLLRAHLPLPSAAQTLRLVRDGILLTELDLAVQLPNVELQWAPDQFEVASGKQKIAWSTTAATGEAFLRYSNDNGRTWMRIGGRSRDAPFEVSFDELPGGRECRIALIYTAGARSTSVLSRAFRVEEKPTSMMVVSPPDGALLAPGVSILLEAAITLPLGAAPSEPPVITWRSDRDGELGCGMTLWTILSEGTHRLSVATPGETGTSAEVRVEVGRPSYHGKT